MGELAAILLQRTKIIDVTQRAAQFLDDSGVALLRFGPELIRNVAHQVGNNPIVVEQRVVNVEKENCFPAGHRGTPRLIEDAESSCKVTPRLSRIPSAPLVSA